MQSVALIVGNEIRQKDRDLDRKYRRILRPAVPVQKSALTLEIGKILNNRKKNDQEKVKDYINVLHRYMNVRNKIPKPEEQDKFESNINPITRPDSLFPLTPLQLLHSTPPPLAAYVGCHDDDSPSPERMKQRKIFWPSWSGTKKRHGMIKCKPKKDHRYSPKGGNSANDDDADDDKLNDRYNNVRLPSSYSGIDTTLRYSGVKLRLA